MRKQEGFKITRITPKKASKFIACADDQLSTPAEYFTLTPSSNSDYPISEGWEDVRYYTNRPRHTQMPKGQVNCQWIYILSNITMPGLVKIGSRHTQMPKGQVNCQWIYILSNITMPGLVKIGFTKNRPGERAKQINAATGVALDFKVEWAFPCFNAHALEREIHAYLEAEGFRVNKKKEFFNITVDQGRSVVERLGESYKMTDYGR